MNKKEQISFIRKNTDTGLWDIYDKNPPIPWSKITQKFIDKHRLGADFGTYSQAKEYCIKEEIPKYNMKRVRI